MRRRLSPIVVFVFHPLRDHLLSHVKTVEELAGERRRRERKGAEAVGVGDRGFTKNG